MVISFVNDNAFTSITFIKNENLNKDKEFKFDGNASHRFSGIFNYLRGNNNKKKYFR